MLHIRPTPEQVNLVRTVLQLNKDMSTIMAKAELHHRAESSNHLEALCNRKAKISDKHNLVAYRQKR